MMRKILILFVMSIASLWLVACASGPSTPAEAVPVEVKGEIVAVSGGAYTDASVAELQTMLKNKDFTFINVHIPFEGDIPGTDLSIPYNEIDQNLSQLPAEKDAKIVLYCRSGNMSETAAETLVGLGYTNVWNITGGMVAWEKAGLPLEK
jgi:rhodanese-related sulfurtransferase